MQDGKSDDALEPLWDKAQHAADTGDMPGLLFVWQALADKGVWQIYARIGWLYELGAKGVQKDVEKALYWYRKAVYEGDDPVGHVGLGRAHYEGVGAKQDFAAALKHFEKAYAHGLPDAAIYLGMMYHSGLGTARNLGKAKACFDLAASQDYFYAYIKLARIAFEENRYIRGLNLWLKGLLLGLRLAKGKAQDPRLLGIKWPQSRR
jgi:TPR repeat protein